ncbi:hypothetical protein SODG_001083 [Sodalis praecaptivus]
MASHAFPPPRAGDGDDRRGGRPQRRTAPGAFYVFANCQGLLGKQTPEGAVLDSDVAVADYLVQSAHVATLQGSAFGTPGYLRIAYAIDDKRLEEACARIGQACARLR